MLKERATGVLTSPQDNFETQFMLKATDVKSLLETATFETYQ